MPIVLGGGIAGLSAAYYMLKRGVTPLTILEGSNRVGGWIKTELNQDKGFMFESGPRTIRPTGVVGKNTLSLMEDMSLTNSIMPIAAGHPAAKNRMIYVNQRLNLLPSDLMGALKTIPPFSRPLIFAVVHDLMTGRSKQALADESIYSFAERRFGKEIADYAICPMVCGICAGDAKEISVNFLLSELFRKEQRWGGVVKGFLIDRLKQLMSNSGSVSVAETKSSLADRANGEKWKIYSLKTGMELLPATMSTQLQSNGVAIKLDHQCEEINFEVDKIRISTVDNPQIETDFLVSTIPAPQLARAVGKQHPTLAADLNQIPYVDVAVVNLQYNSSNVLKHNAFGFLAPASENTSILGITFDSCCFDMSGNTVLTVMMGGKWFNELFGAEPTEKDLLDIALASVRKTLQIDEQPTTSRVHILRQCIPQYVVGHEATVNRIRQYIAERRLPLAICGAAYGGIGVNDVIFNARKLVDNFQINTNGKLL